MQIHRMVSSSGVNGPGRRAVVWFQGCALGCPGCWNPSTHAFGGAPDFSVEQVRDYILLCAGIEGVTFSGGEPFQQAESLAALCESLKAHNPDLSIAIFSGYTIRELRAGRWRYRCDRDQDWHQGTGELFARIESHLDFGIFGRFSQAHATDDMPLCGSCNQEVVFFTDRYSSQDLEPQACEINISQDGQLIEITGFPPADLVQTLLTR